MMARKRCDRTARDGETTQRLMKLFFASYPGVFISEFLFLFSLIAKLLARLELSSRTHLLEL